MDLPWIYWGLLRIYCELLRTTLDLLIYCGLLRICRAVDSVDLLGITIDLLRICCGFTADLLLLWIYCRALAGQPQKLREGTKKLQQLYYDVIPVGCGITHIKLYPAILRISELPAANMTLTG